MKKLISTLLSVVILVSSLSFTTTAFAKSINSAQTAGYISVGAPATVQFTDNYSRWWNDIDKDWNSYDEVWYRFVAPSTDYYEFEIVNPIIRNDYATASFYIKDSIGGHVDSASYNSITRAVKTATMLTQGQTYYINVYANLNDDEVYNCQFVVRNHAHSYSQQVYSYTDGSYTTYYDCITCGYYFYVDTPAPVVKVTPKKTSISKVTAKKKALNVKYKKVSNVSGYQIQVATDSKFKNNKKTVTVKSSKTTSKDVTGLKAKKKYYVRVRTYTTINGVKYYSGWSSVKNLKTK